MSAPRSRPELPRVPWTYLEEPAPASRRWPGLPCALLRLSEAYDDEADHAERRGWPVRRLPLRHLAPVTHPGAVADAVERLLADLESASA